MSYLTTSHLTRKIRTWSYLELQSCRVTCTVGPPPGKTTRFSSTKSVLLSSLVYQACSGLEGVFYNYFISIHCQFSGLNKSHHDCEVAVSLVNPAGPQNKRWGWRNQSETNLRQRRPSKLQIVREGKIMIII